MSKLRLKTTVAALACVATLALPLAATATPTGLALTSRQAAPMSSAPTSVAASSGVDLRGFVKRELRRLGRPGIGTSPVRTHPVTDPLVDLYLDGLIEVSVPASQLEAALDFALAERRAVRPEGRAADDGDAGCVSVTFSTRSAGGHQVGDWVSLDCVNLR